ncbi:CobW family GTP-binding protein [Achromobacter insolitus]|uniref:P-loop guanosine triphosphatase YjiA n=1 Tax=Achromobacter insolitus TaxID=217204 RepID=A0A6S7EVM3_9BURK|nr:GTP-binding protein [Achromobacter insolitus]CAB3929382.1 P-loop guanosine triphosphatase YjiA [Achromobacter insolitus]CAB3944895.1 P-loop guanosine triphosphatase YjiA [Achromobacter insolitus]
MADIDRIAAKIPVSLITGFLGCGKTTLISKLVLQPEMARAAVVINEIGEIGIDHELVTHSSENISVLANGCICCTIRTDLQESLRDLFGQRRAGRIPDFDRVIVETTGLADPAPIVQTLASDDMLSNHYRLDGVVTLADAVNIHGQLRAHPEAVKQLALADRILLSKGDLVTPVDLDAAKGEIQDINPHAQLLRCEMGDISAHMLTGLNPSTSRASADTLRFLGSSFETGEHTGSAYLGSRSGRHRDIDTLSLRFPDPFDWLRFNAAMDLIAALRGPDLLRMKGIVNIEGAAWVIQGVQHVFHPPVALDCWPTEDQTSRLVFITRGISESAINGVFAAVGAISKRQT